MLIRITYQVYFHHKKLSLTNVTMDVNNKQHQHQIAVAVQTHLQDPQTQDRNQVTLTVSEAADILGDIGDQFWEEHCNAASQSKAKMLIYNIPSLMICVVAALTIYQLFR